MKTFYRCLVFSGLCLLLVGLFALTVMASGSQTLERPLASLRGAVVFIGILLPLAPLIAGLLLPRVQKLGHPKHWYALAVTGGLWLAAGIAILLIIALV